MIFDQVTQLSQYKSKIKEEQQHQTNNIDDLYIRQLENKIIKQTENHVD